MSQPASDDGGAARRALEIFGLCGFAVVQPLLDLLGRNPTFFVAHRVTTTEVALLVAAVTVGIPAVLLSIEFIVGWLSRRAAEWVHVSSIGLLGALVAVPVVDRVVRLPWIAAPVALAAVSAGLVYLFRRNSGARRFVAVLGPAPLVFVLLFVLVSPAGGVFRADRTAAASASGVRPASVFFLVLDQLPVGHLMDAQGGIAARRFPNFARLAQTSTWYRNATTVYPYTEKSVPAILSGRFPDNDGAPTLAHYRQNLFTLLRSSHELRVQEKVTDLCPPDACTEGPPRAGEGLRPLLVDSAFAYAHLALPASWRDGLPPIDDRWAGFAEPTSARAADDGCDPDPEDVTAAFDELLADVWSHEPPTLHFLHVLMPHRPWRYLPDGQTYEEGHMAGFAYRSSVWGHHEGLVNRALQQEMLQLAYTDTLIGRLLDRLEREGLLSDSVIVLTSDHGMAFSPGEHVRRMDAATTHEVFEEAARVPLFLKRPGQTTGEIVDDNVETIDIIPTLADILGFSLPEPVDGQSVVNPQFVPRDRKQAAGRPAEINWPPDLDSTFPVGAKMDRLFGPDTDQMGLYALGPNRDLVGQRVRDLPLSRDPAARATVDQADAFDAVKPQSGCVPARVDGSIRPGHEGEVAVVLNGVVAGIGPTFPTGPDASDFIVLVRPDLFEEGSNDVGVLLIDGEGEARRLRAVRIEP